MRSKMADYSELGEEWFRFNWSKVAVRHGEKPEIDYLWNTELNHEELHENSEPLVVNA
jgi:hypothetical protein